MFSDYIEHSIAFCLMILPRAGYGQRIVREVVVSGPAVEAVEDDRTSWPELEAATGLH